MVCEAISCAYFFFNKTAQLKMFLVVGKRDFWMLADSVDGVRKGLNKTSINYNTMLSSRKYTIYTQ